MSETKVAKRTSSAAAPKHGLFAELLNRMERFGMPSGPFGWFFGPESFELMRDMTREMNRTFFTSSGEDESMWLPRLEMKRVDGNLIIAADLPGVKKEDIKIEVADNELIIQGERTCEEKQERNGFYRSEKSYGRFSRIIALPEGAKTDQVKAELKDGVLEVRIPAPDVKENRRTVPITEDAEVGH